MKYFKIFVVLCNLASSCIANMDIDLEPTPLAFHPFNMKDNQNARTTCTVSCTKVLKSLSSSIKSATDLANTLASASSSISAACKGLDTTTAVDLPTCPPTGILPKSSAPVFDFTTSVEATPALMEPSEMPHTAAAYSSLH